MRLLLLVVSLTLLAGPAVADGRAMGESDPTGDVYVAPAGATKAQQRSVDVTESSYELDDKATLVVETQLVKLADVPGNEFVETIVRSGGKTLDFSSEIGAPGVKVFDGDHLYSCSGAKVTVVGSTVTQRVPLSCFRHGRRATFQGVAMLARNDGTTIASDTARPLGPFALD